MQYLNRKCKERQYRLLFEYHRNKILQRIEDKIGIPHLAESMKNQTYVDDIMKTAHQLAELSFPTFTIYKGKDNRKW